MMQWIDIKEKLPEPGQTILIMWRYRKGCCWSYLVTYYLPFNKSGKPKKFPFGNTYEVKSWCPIPKLPEYGFEEDK